MCKFKPFNKHLLVQKIPQVKKPDLSPVLLPDDIQVGRSTKVWIGQVHLCSAKDCDLFLRDLNPDQPTWATQRGTMDDVFTTSAKNNGNASLVVDKSMVEEIKIEDKTFNIVHQNYVVGVIDE